MKKILQKVIDDNKGNIGFVGTDSNGRTVITDSDNKIIYDCWMKGKFVDYDNGKISIHKEE